MTGIPFTIEPLTGVVREVGALGATAPHVSAARIAAASADEIDDLIEQLGDNVIEVREAATRSINELLCQEPDITLLMQKLETARTNPDPEISARAAEILSAFRRGHCIRLVSRVDEVFDLQIIWEWSSIQRGLIVVPLTNWAPVTLRINAGVLSIPRVRHVTNPPNHDGEDTGGEPTDFNGIVLSDLGVGRTADHPGRGHEDEFTLRVSGNLIILTGKHPSTKPEDMGQQILINDRVRLVSLVPANRTFHEGLHPDPFPITATFRSLSQVEFTDLFFQVVYLNGESCPCTVVNADGGPGGVGAEISVPNEALGPDGKLSVDERFFGNFQIDWTDHTCCFTFLVNVWGKVDP